MSENKSLSPLEKIFIDAPNLLNTEICDGFDISKNKWEVIVKYNGDIKKIISELDIAIEILNDSYAIIFDTAEKIIKLSKFNEIIYIEKAKLLGVVDQKINMSSCVTPLQNDLALTGRGVIIAIIDTGLNIKLKEFLNADNTSRVLFYWDQTLDNNPPKGFLSGTEYSQSELNKIIQDNKEFLSTDSNGHGTMVASIAAANKKIKGIAPEADLIIVKIDSLRPLTTQIMRGIKYSLDKASELQKPIAINISFGTNNGAHDGKSLFESYINDVAEDGISSIIVAAGNEGIAAHHYQNIIKQNQVLDIEFITSGGIKSLFLTLWKSFVDKFLIEFISPDGKSTGKLNSYENFFVINQTRIYIFIGTPTPYNFDQEIYFQFVSEQDNIDDGVWTLRIFGEEIIDGRFDIWLPITEVATRGTKFLQPSLNTTLTLPATAENVISVGGYDSSLNAIANFTGRGYTRNNLIKPDLVAPAVNVSVINSSGTVDNLSGTSLATPHVTGAAALMMEWGIIKKNSPYLYGQKLKSYLRLGADRKNGLVFPNNQWGYGSLCIQKTFDYLKLENQNYFALSENNFINSDELDDINNNPVLSENYYEMIVKYNDYVEEILKKSAYIKSCAVLDNTYVIINIPVDKFDEFMQTTYTKIIAEWPSLMTLMDKASMDVSGITAVQNQPYLDLRGSGVLIGFVDTGIDYTKQNFIYEDNTSKIISIWDQTINNKKEPPIGFCYGTEFSNQEINLALNSEEPFKIVPHIDENGHGTFLASLAAGRDENENIGAAPDADLIIVKLKQAKNNIRERFLINQNAVAFQASDVLTGIEYLYRKALQLDKPIVICIGLGTNDGAHFGESLVEEYITNVARQKGVVMCIAAGNEGSAQHHIQGKLSNNGDSNDIEINVADDEKGFVFQIWNFPPNKVSVAVTSPFGERIERLQPKDNFYNTTKLPLENTTVTVGYEFPKNNSAGQLTLIKLREPTPGLWTITLYGDIISDGFYFGWLPVTGFISPDTFLLNSTPEATITAPATASGVITVGAYNIKNNNLYVDGSRGPKQSSRIAPNFITPSLIAPSLVAPGVNVAGLYPYGYGSMTGTSVSTAIVTGACALLLEWAVIKQNQPSMNTLIAWSYLIQGCTQQSGFVFPNNQWGYGKLNLIDSFEALKLM